jgi:hypothetical protein
MESVTSTGIKTGEPIAVVCQEQAGQLAAARSAALRSTQNSLPSGSVMTTKPRPAGLAVVGEDGGADTE